MHYNGNDAALLDLQLQAMPHGGCELRLVARFLPRGLAGLADQIARHLCQRLIAMAAAILHDHPVAARRADPHRSRTGRYRVTQPDPWRCEICGAQHVVASLARDCEDHHLEDD